MGKMLLKKHYIHAIAVFMAVYLCITLLATAVEAHWNMEPKFWVDESKEKFFVLMHNKAHANHDPVKERIEVCFWIEEVRDKVYKRVSEKKCMKFVLEPNELKTVSFDLKELSVSLRKGNYRAVAVARQVKSKIVKFFMGAAMARLSENFEVK